MPVCGQSPSVAYVDQRDPLSPTTLQSYGDVGAWRQRRLVPFSNSGALPASVAAFVTGHDLFDAQAVLGGLV